MCCDGLLHCVEDALCGLVCQPERCPRDIQGLRDAALLSLACDTGLRVAELVRVEVEHITLESDKTASLDIPTSKTDQEGQGALAWLSRDTVRRIAAWREAAEIEVGPLFRRIGVVRTKARDGTPIPEIAGYVWR